MKYFFTALVAALSTVFVSCSDDNTMTTMPEFQLTSSYVSLPMEGGSASIDVNATADWKVISNPDWVTIDKMNGGAGQSKITFSAEKTLDGRIGEVQIDVDGKLQRINVIQGLATISEATVAEVMAGPDSKTYQVKGTVTKITETATYGNFYINDGTSDTDLYIYGTKYNGQTKQAALEKLGVEVGDEIIVSGPKTTYNGTVELVDVDVVKLNKSLIKVDSTTIEGDALPIEGGEFSVALVNKGNGVYVDIPEDAKNWLTISAIKGSSIVFKAAANEGGDRSTTVVFKTTDGKKDYTAELAVAQKGAVAKVTCAEFNAKADGSAQYKVHGIVTSIANAKYGNLYINDGTGEVYVYGITDWANDIKVGDEVVLQSVKTSYKDAAQMKNAIVLEKVAHDVKTVAELLTLNDDKNTFYLVSGEVFEMTGDNIKFDLNTYGNFGLKDETGEIYVYGVADALDGVTKNFAATGVKVGDKITILAYKTSYKGVNQVVGKFIKKD